MKSTSKTLNKENISKECRLILFFYCYFICLLYSCYCFTFSLLVFKKTTFLSLIKTIASSLLVRYNYKRAM